MIKKIFIVFLFILSFSFKARSQNISHLIEIYDQIIKFDNDENYKEVLRLSNILITKSPPDSELHLMGYAFKTVAEVGLEDYRNAIIDASKALELDTKQALMIRQPDLILYIKYAKSLLYLYRGGAKDSIGLIESSEADIKKAKECDVLK